MPKLKVKNYYSIDELAEVMEIDAISAKELLEGTIHFLRGELGFLADYKGISVSDFFEDAKYEQNNYEQNLIKSI